MTRQHKISALIGYSIALVGVVVVAILVLASPSQGAPVCRVQRVQRVVTAVAPVYAQAYYQVGAQLQQQAVDTQSFRSSPEYLEYLQLKGFQAGVAAVQQQRVETTTAPPPASTLYTRESDGPTRHELETMTADDIKASPGYVGEMDLKAGQWHPAPGYDGPTPIPPQDKQERPGGPVTIPGTWYQQTDSDPEWRAIPGQAGPQAPTAEDFPRPQGLPSPPAAPGSPEWESFKARYPTIAQNCAGCHGQKNPEAPEGDLFLNGGMALDGPEGTPRRDAIVRMLWLGRMPKGKPADDQMISAILDELYPVEPEPAPAPPGPST